MCSCVYAIWKTCFLLLVLHKLLNKSKNSATPLPLALDVFCQTGINNKLFGAGTILHCVLLEPLSLHFYLMYPCKNAVQILADD